MNQQVIKILKTGIFAGFLAGIIELIISAVATDRLGQNIDADQFILGGLTIGFITLVLTVIISAVIASRGKQKNQ